MPTNRLGIVYSLTLFAGMLVLAAAMIELMAASGRLSDEVLAQLLPAGNAWWGAPAAAHVSLAVVLGGLLTTGVVVRWPLRASQRERLLPPLPDARHAWVVAVLLTLLTVYLFLAQFGELERVVSRTTDFGSIYEAASALARGLDPYSETAGAYFYPPTFAVLFRPLLALPVCGASTLWFALKLTMLVWTMMACWEMLEAARLSPARQAVFVFGLFYVAARFWIADLQFGNTNVLILFLGVAALYFDQKKRTVPAAVALALAISIKVVPLLLAGYFLARRRWRMLGWMLIAVVIVNAGASLAMGDAAGTAWSSYSGYGVGAKLSSRLAQPDNQSLWGALNRTLPGMSLGSVRFVWAIVSALLGAAAMMVAWRSDTRTPRAQALAASPFFLLQVLISPGSWVVHYCAVLLPMAVLWRWLLDEGRRSAPYWTLFVALNLVFGSSGWSRWSVRFSIEKSCFVIAALALFVALVLMAARAARTQAPASTT